MGLKLNIFGLTTGMALAIAAGVTSFEGNKSVPYRDVGGVWTACVGDTHDIDPAHRYTPQECQDRLVAQLEAHNAGLLKCMPDLVNAPDTVHAGLLDLGYNAGVGAVCKSSIAAKVKARNYPAACATIGDFYKAAGRDCHIRSNNCYGIIKRRDWEMALCNGELSQDQIAKGYAGFLEASQ